MAFSPRGKNIFRNLEIVRGHSGISFVLGLKDYKKKSSKGPECCIFIKRTNIWIPLSLHFVKVASLDKSHAACQSYPQLDKHLYPFFRAGNGRFPCQGRARAPSRRPTAFRSRSSRRDVRPESQHSYKLMRIKISMSTT